MNTLKMDQETANQHVEKIFSLINKKKELSLSFHDYVAATTLAKKETYERKLVKLFEELDSNKDGSITKEELSKAVEELTTLSCWRSALRMRLHSYGVQAAADEPL